MTDIEKEIADLYWNSDIPVWEIMETYGMAMQDILRLAGPATLDGVECRYCTGPVLVYSRSQARERLHQLFHEKSKLAEGGRADT